MTTDPAYQSRRYINIDDVPEGQPEQPVVFDSHDEMPCAVIEIDDTELKSATQMTQAVPVTDLILTSMSQVPGTNKTRFRFWSERFQAWTKDNDEPEADLSGAREMAVTAYSTAILED